MCKGKGRDITIIPDNLTAITAALVTFILVFPNMHLEARRTASNSIKIVNHQAIFQNCSTRFPVIQIDIKVIARPHLSGLAMIDKITLGFVIIEYKRAG